MVSNCCFFFVPYQRKCDVIASFLFTSCLQNHLSISWSLTFSGLNNLAAWGSFARVGSRIVILWRAWVLFKNYVPVKSFERCGFWERESKLTVTCGTCHRFPGWIGFLIGEKRVEQIQLQFVQLLWHPKSSMNSSGISDMYHVLNTHTQLSHCRSILEVRKRMEMCHTVWSIWEEHNLIRTRWLAEKCAGQALSTYEVCGDAGWVQCFGKYTGCEIAMDRRW